MVPAAPPPCAARRNSVLQQTAVTLTQASRQWMTRPNDERYLSLEDLRHATLDRTSRSLIRTVSHESLVVRVREDTDAFLYLEHPELGELLPTHWSMSQLATRSHTPTSWIRDMAKIPVGPALAAHAINLGLRYLAERGQVQAMALNRAEGSELRALVGPDYGRIYDHEVVEAVMEANAEGTWQVPASRPGVNPLRATTLYGSDRDVFIFLVDERYPVRVNTPEGVRYLFRGFMVWNSEVGHHRLGLMTFLYDHVCDNRMVWGAREVKEVRIRHTKYAPQRFAREIRPALQAFTTSSTKEVESQLERAARMQLGTSDAEILEWLRKHDFTKPEGEKMIEAAKAEEGGARTLWQVVNGGTAMARAIPHADSRVLLERRVSGLLRAAA